MTYSATIQNTKISITDSYMMQIIGGSLLMALSAQIAIPLWFTPVPLTLQTLTAMIIGGMLGRKNGALAVIFYLTQISAGLPFCSGGISDSLRLIGPTGGYLIGMVLQAYLVGWIMEQRKVLSYWMILLGMALISCIQMTMGAAVLSYFVGLSNTFKMGFLPFVPGELLKVFVATSFCLSRRE